LITSYLKDINSAYIGQSGVYKKLRKHKKLNLDIIDTVNINEWEFWEKFYISYFKSIGVELYNIHSGGKLETFRKPIRLNKPTKSVLNENYYSVNEIKDKLTFYNIPLNWFLKNARLKANMYQSILDSEIFPTLLIKQRMYFSIRKYEFTFCS